MTLSVTRATLFTVLKRPWIVRRAISQRFQATISHRFEAISGACLERVYIAIRNLIKLYGGRINPAFDWFFLFIPVPRIFPLPTLSQCDNIKNFVKKSKKFAMVSDRQIFKWTFTVKSASLNMVTVNIQTSPWKEFVNYKFLMVPWSTSISFQFPGDHRGSFCGTVQ